VNVPSSNDVIPEPIASLLRGALSAERVATGHDRTAAFRLTRHLFGGAIALGVSPAAIAELAGTAEGSVRNRGNTGGIVSPTDFAGLAQIPIREIAAWESHGLLPAASIDPLGVPGYPAEALLRALLATTAGGRPTPAASIPADLRAVTI
jgi:hypothetical protein